MLPAVKLFETCAHITQAQALALNYIGPAREARSTVSYFQAKKSVCSFCRDGDLTWPGPGGNRVLDRVLHHRLEDKMRHLCGQRRGFDLELDREAIAKTNLLYFQVTAHEF